MKFVKNGINYSQKFFLKRKTLSIFGMGFMSYGILTYKKNTNEKFKRNYYFWVKATPIFFHYKLTQFLVEMKKGISEKEKKMKFDDLHRRYADEIYEILKNLKGFYVKVGQLAAQRLDVIPFIWIEKLKNLESNMPYKNMEEVRKVIESDYNKPLEEIFSEFDPVPLGSASIGQVHKAVLAESNQKVAVKVLYRDAKKYFESDLKTLKRFVKLVQPQILPFVQQWDDLFEEEFNCIMEANKLIEVKKNLKKIWKGKVIVPKAYLELCRKNVLVMEFLDGKKLSKPLVELHKFYKNNENYKKSKIFNFILKIIKIPYFGRLIEKNILFLRNIISSFTEVPAIINLLYLREIIRTLISVHAHQLFKNRIFNPDPHGGNVLILKSGEIGLLDYGQAKRVSKSFINHFSKVLIALNEKDFDSVVYFTRKIGLKTKKNDPNVIKKTIQLFFGDGKTNGEIFPVYMEKLFLKDPLTEYPSDLFMAGKLTMILRGMAMLLWPQVSMARFYGPFAEQIIKN